MRAICAGSILPRFMNLTDKIRERDLYRDFDASIVGSNHMARMLAVNGFPASRVHMIPYFSAFAAQAPRPVEVDPSIPGLDRPFELLFTGQAVVGKGLEVLIEALRGLPGDWRLSVCGEGPRLLQARQKAESYGIADRITFHAWVPQSALMDHYKKADIFVLPSVWDDPGPLVGIEAMSFGAPIVGFAVGGVPDYLIDGQTGVLVREVSARALHDGLLHAMSCPETLAQMGREGYKLVAQRHTLAAHLDGVEAVYRQIDRRLPGDAEGRA